MQERENKSLDTYAPTQGNSGPGDKSEKADSRQGNSGSGDPLTKDVQERSNSGRPDSAVIEDQSRSDSLIKEQKPKPSTVSLGQGTQKEGRDHYNIGSYGDNVVSKDGEKSEQIIKLDEVKNQGAHAQDDRNDKDKSRSAESEEEKAESEVSNHEFTDENQAAPGATIDNSGSERFSGFSDTYKRDSNADDQKETEASKVEKKELAPQAIKYNLQQRNTKVEELDKSKKTEGSVQRKDSANEGSPEQPKANVTTRQYTGDDTKAEEVASIVKGQGVPEKKATSNPKASQDSLFILRAAELPLRGLQTRFDELAKTSRGGDKEIYRELSIVLHQLQINIVYFLCLYIGAPEGDVKALMDCLDKRREVDLVTGDIDNDIKSYPNDKDLASGKEDLTKSKVALFSYLLGCLFNSDSEYLSTYKNKQAHLNLSDPRARPILTQLNELISDFANEYGKNNTNLVSSANFVIIYLQYIADVVGKLEKHHPNSWYDVRDARYVFNYSLEYYPVVNDHFFDPSHSYQEEKNPRSLFPGKFFSNRESLTFLTSSAWVLKSVGGNTADRSTSISDDFIATGAHLTALYSYIVGGNTADRSISISDGFIATGAHLTALYSYIEQSRAELSNENLAVRGLVIGSIKVILEDFKAYQSNKQEEKEANQIIFGYNTEVYILIERNKDKFVALCSALTSEQARVQKDDKSALAMGLEILLRFYQELYDKVKITLDNCRSEWKKLTQIHDDKVFLEEYKGSTIEITKSEKYPDPDQKQKSPIAFLTPKQAIEKDIEMRNSERYESLKKQTTLLGSQDKLVDGEHVQAIKFLSDIKVRYERILAYLKSLKRLGSRNGIAKDAGIGASNWSQYVAEHIVDYNSFAKLVVDACHMFEKKKTEDLLKNDLSGSDRKLEIIFGDKQEFPLFDIGSVSYVLGKMYGLNRISIGVCDQGIATTFELIDYRMNGQPEVLGDDDVLRVSFYAEVRIQSRQGDSIVSAQTHRLNLCFFGRSLERNIELLFGKQDFINFKDQDLGKILSKQIEQDIQNQGPLWKSFGPIACQRFLPMLVDGTIKDPKRLEEEFKGIEKEKSHRFDSKVATNLAWGAHAFGNLDEYVNYWNGSYGSMLKQKLWKQPLLPRPGTEKLDGDPASEFFKNLHTSLSQSKIDENGQKIQEPQVPDMTGKYQALLKLCNSDWSKDSAGKILNIIYGMFRLGFYPQDLNQLEVVGELIVGGPFSPYQKKGEVGVTTKIVQKIWDGAAKVNQVYGDLRGGPEKKTSIETNRPTEEKVVRLDEDYNPHPLILGDDVKPKTWTDSVKGLFSGNNKQSNTVILAPKADDFSGPGAKDTRFVEREQDKKSGGSMLSKLWRK